MMAGGERIIERHRFTAWVCALFLIHLLSSLPFIRAGPVVSQSSLTMLGGNPMNAAHQQLASPAVVITDLARHSDDGVALLMLLRSHAIDIKGIITTAGNVCALEAAKETRKLLQAVGARTLPVIEGPPLSWHEKRRRYYLNVEKPSWPKHAYVGAFAADSPCAGDSSEKGPVDDALLPANAADFLIAVAKQNAGELVVVLMGPATVLAQAVKKEPKLASMISRIYAMGGSLDAPGNVTPYAEFNVWFDPEAAAELFSSGAAITLVPLDATGPVSYALGSRARLPSGDPGAEYLARYLEFRRADARNVPMWDEVLAAVVIDPSVIIGAHECFLTVSTRAGPQYGRVLSLSSAVETSQPPIKVVTGVDAARVRTLLSDLMSEKR